MAAAPATDIWQPYVDRFRSGEWRSPIFRDMILADLKMHGDKPRVLDIGCGNGFDGEAKIQQEIAQVSGAYIGVEPDAAMPLGSWVTESHRCFFEDAPIADESIDLAFAVMVLEHLPDPAKFWDKLAKVLKPGGIFWGFTVDARHRFARASLLLEKMRLKDLYLNLVLGSRGTERYHNYPVYYRANSPEQIRPLTTSFESLFLPLHGPGRLAEYFPKLLRPLVRQLDREAPDKPGILLAARLVKPRLA